MIIDNNTSYYACPSNFFLYSFNFFLCCRYRRSKVRIIVDIIPVLRRRELRFLHKPIAAYYFLTYVLLPFLYPSVGGPPMRDNTYKQDVRNYRTGNQTCREGEKNVVILLSLELNLRQRTYDDSMFNAWER